MALAKNMKSDMLSGLKWTGLSTIIVNGSKLLQIVILTKFLEKEDFGVFAIAMLFIGFINVLLDMGLSTAILHKQNIPKKHYSSLFWLNVFTGLVLSIILFSCSNLIAYAYDESQLVTIIQLLSLNIFFASLGQQHRIQRQKQLDFKLLGIFESVSALLALGTATILAVMGYGIYSLIYATLCHMIFLSLLLLCYGLYKDKNISLYFRLNDTLPYLKIGIYQLGSGLLDFFAKELDVFIVSITLGKDTLGVYSLCKQLPISLYLLLSTVITKVATPMFAKIQDDIAYVKDRFLKLIGIVAVFSLPIYFLLGLLSPIVLRYLYGVDYMEDYWILTAMFLAHAFLTVAGTFSAIQVAFGRTDIGFFWTIYRVAVTTVLIYAGAQFSLEGLLIAFLLNYFLNATLSFWYIQVRTILGLSLFEYLKPQIYPFVTSIALFVLFKWIFGDLTILKSIVMSFAFMVAYCMLIYYFKRGSYEIDFFTDGACVLAKVSKRKK